MYFLSICDSENTLYLLGLIGTLIKFIAVVIIVAIIIMGMLDAFKQVTSNEVDASKALKTILKRIMAGVLALMMIPIVRLVVISIDSESESLTCISAIVGTRSTENQWSDNNFSESYDDNKNQCEQENKKYIKKERSQILDILKNEDYYLEDNNYGYICVDGEVE